ncbi:ABC transporter ATP-binding protein [Ureibacillus manganicus]|uniref:Daunorubicin ABC transporter ATPase n=1 Tax=Ureibacillus manganicus DSM 26584 TaxID=1384049 RepID=A0A0A3I3C2_9BACL|nr:ABC transporter ATP-binding protein [Ureibacillus manganicus]KGR78005.1 daunorubicin ABC transporter ATPase [Ureibacillus manganicus DSM 26584]
MSESVIQVQQVKRIYEVKTGIWKKEKKEVEAVKGISFEVKKGEIFGLLGPNGAGKTTMIKMLTTMLIPTSGSIQVLGFNPINQHKQLRPHINFILGGERNLYWRLSAYDNLAYFADLYKIPRSVQKERIPQLLKLVELEEAADRRVETFSKGMKQRLQIARGLLNNPKILFLDEPSIGLDPVSARKLRDILRDLNEQGTTIVLTTHYMYEADELCDRIAFINHGELIAIDTPQNLKQRTNHLSVIECKLENCTKQEITRFLEEGSSSISEYEIQEELNLLKVRLHADEPQKVVSLLYNLPNLNVQDLSITKPTLEDAYITMVGGV